MLWRYGVMGHGLCSQDLFKTYLYGAKCRCRYLYLAVQMLHAKLRAMVIPYMKVNSINELKPEWLKQEGIKAVMVDLDDTLLASNTEQLSQEAKDWVQSLKDNQLSVTILSNGTKSRVHRSAEVLKVTGFALTGKPFFGFRKALKTLNAKPRETVMIGDQLFTDILGANLLGIKSILVTPLSNKGLVHTKMLRHIEAYILKKSNTHTYLYPNGGKHGSPIHR